MSIKYVKGQIFKKFIFIFQEIKYTDICSYVFLIKPLSYSFFVTFSKAKYMPKDFFFFSFPFSIYSRSLGVGFEGTVWQNLALLDDGLADYCPSQLWY